MPKKWQLCVVLFLATTLNYLDRQTMSILAPSLQKELHLGNADLGWLFAVFYYAYTFAQMAVGPILDRSNLRWAFAWAVFLWSLVSVLTGLANGFVALLIFRLALGVVESRVSQVHASAVVHLRSALKDLGARGAFNRQGKPGARRSRSAEPYRSKNQAGNR